MKVLIATANVHKLKEYRELLRGFAFKAPKNLPSVSESGKTFKANAVIKARAYGQKFGLMTIADDSGLEIKALNGFPGIRSARFAGGNFAKARKEILKRLAGTADRRARFVCVIAVYLPGNKIKTFTGTVNGRIANKETGNHGFGYDPIFFVPKIGRTFAQMSLKQKNFLSHRGRAAEKLIAFLKKSM